MVLPLKTVEPEKFNHINRVMFVISKMAWDIHRNMAVCNVCCDE